MRGSSTVMRTQITWAQRLGMLVKVDELQYFRRLFPDSVLRDRNFYDIRSELSSHDQQSPLNRVRLLPLLSRYVRPQSVAFITQQARKNAVQQVMAHIQATTAARLSFAHSKSSYLKAERAMCLEPLQAGYSRRRAAKFSDTIFVPTSTEELAKRVQNHVYEDLRAPRRGAVFVVTCDGVHTAITLGDQVAASKSPSQDCTIQADSTPTSNVVTLARAGPFSVASTDAGTTLCQEVRNGVRSTTSLTFDEASRPEECKVLPQRC